MPKSRSVLGRGLNALIPKPETYDPLTQGTRSEDTAVGPDHRHPESLEEMIAHLEISKIRPNPYQPRADFDEVALDELKRSIQEKGIIQPITVRRTDDGMYQLITGERRIRAVREAGLSRIPAYVRRVKSEAEMLELALIENLQREHLNPIEIGISYQRLIDEVQLTQEEIARKIGKDRTTVTNFIRLLKLPLKIQQSLRQGNLTMGHARALVGIPDDRLQLRLFERIVKRGLSVRRVEELVRHVGKQKTKSRRPTATGVDESVEHIESKLRQILGTKVTVTANPDGRGQILIEYYSDDDLDRLLELFVAIEKYN
ncbi:MAG: ParB/RepB/Spo0J family partition protein [Bacteroidota bacterium]